ncbi:MAG: hypothetical protein PWP40_2341, partial [Rhodocyclaceae bacterium]|nr:hypothetical protein [Rhodocyclaceae bacterium]
MSSRSSLGALALACSLIATLSMPPSAEAAAAQCLVPGTWVRTDGASPQPVDGGTLLAAMAQRAVVL